MFKPKGVMFLTLVIMLLGLSCSGPESDQPLLTAELPLHLEEHLDKARISGSDVPIAIQEPAEWDFSESQPDWKQAVPLENQWQPVQMTRIEDGLRLTLTEKARWQGTKWLFGSIYVGIPDWKVEDWAYVLIRARSTDRIPELGISYNLREKIGDGIWAAIPFKIWGNNIPIIPDGSVHTYVLKVGWSGELGSSWRHLAIWFGSEKPASVDILSVSVIPIEAEFVGKSVGIKTIERSQANRRAIYIHAPGRLEYKVRVPKAGRLDVGLGVLKKNSPVTFRIVASQTDKDEVTLFEETYANQEEWGQRSVDLSSIAGKTVRIALEADAERSGAVALWSAPTLTGKRSTKKPNIIFYIIDGAGVDHMSVYGYNRRLPRTSRD